MRRSIRYLVAGSVATCGISLALSAGAEAVAAPILATHFQTSSIASVTIDGVTTPLHLLNAGVSIGDANASCVVTPPDVPYCTVTLYAFWASFQTFSVTTTSGTFNVMDPGISLVGPMGMNDVGSGFVLPTRSTFSVSGELSGTFSDGSSVPVTPFVQPATTTDNVTVNLSVPNQSMTVTGTFPFTDTAFGRSVSGSISMMLSAISPFDNVPPVALTFDGGNTPNPWPYPDWASGEYKAECSSPAPVFGLSAFGQAHSVMCESPFTPLGGADLPFNSSGMTTEIFSWGNSPDYGRYGDWDYGYIKGDCPADQFVVGVAQTPSGLMDHSLCASAVVDGSGFEQVPSTTCRTLSFPGNNPASLPDGDWAYGYYKLECDYSEAVVGVSVDPSSHQPHSILCCELIDTGGH